MSTDLLTEFEHTPNPGSRLAHAQSAADQYTPDAGAVALSARPEVEEQYIVQTREERPEHAAYSTVVLAPGTAQIISGRNDCRARITLQITKNNCYLAGNKELAQSIAGTAGTPPFTAPGFWATTGSSYTFMNTEEVWAAVPPGVSGNVIVAAVVEWFE